MGNMVFNIKANSTGIYDTEGNTLAGSSNMPFYSDKSPLSSNQDKRCMKVDADHRIVMTMKTPVSVRGTDWTFGFWFKSTNNGSANHGDWSIAYDNGNDISLELDTDHAWGGSNMWGVPTLGWYTQPWHTKVCDQNWHQIMMCHKKENNCLYSFSDGILQSTMTTDMDMVASTVYIGGKNSSRNYYVDGYLDDMYLIRDNCMHTNNFSPSLAYATDILNIKRVIEELPTNKTYGYK